LVGHGVGYEVHEDPNVPNFNTREQFPVLPAGAVIAIEPMIGLGTAKFQLDQDDWTYRTADGSVSVHVEHTVAVTAAGPLILTAL
jgi:methionyl aminopeptidase